MKFLKESALKKWIAATLTLMALPLLVQAQDAAAGETAGSADFFLWVILGIEVVLGALLLVLIGVLLKVKGYLAEKYGEAAEAEAEPGFMEVFTAKLTDAVPIEREADVMLAHEYDGIRELDNNLPPWWTGLFYVTIIFGVVYLFHYHILGTGDLQIAEYNKEMEEARVQMAKYQQSQAESIDEFNVEADMGDQSLAVGQTIFKANCAACHGQAGEGGVGPNLTDDYWIHGGDVKDIFKIIKHGMPAKGMISWKSQLSPPQMQNVSSYILTLRGTNPPNAKEPQGDLYVPEESEAPAEEAEEETTPATTETSEENAG